MSGFKTEQEGFWAGEFGAQYINRNPDRPGDAYYNLGLCQMELSRFDEASQSLAKAAEEKPQDSQINGKLAEAYQKSGQNL